MLCKLFSLGEFIKYCVKTIHCINSLYQLNYSVYLLGELKYCVLFTVLIE